mgnify:CR=1 FL=1
MTTFLKSKAQCMPAVTTVHAAALLGAAKKLASERNFGGKVVLVFQPGEEAGPALST